MTQIQIALRLAEDALKAGDTPEAIGWLSQARVYARTGTNQRSKAIACHCTAAIQALLPVSLEGLI